MKTFALSTLYVFSIVLAIGIGMASTGRNDSMGARQSECKQDTNENDCPPAAGWCGKYNTCKTVAPGAGADSCSSNSSRCYNSSVSNCNSLSYQRDHYTLTYADCNAE